MPNELKRIEDIALKMASEVRTCLVECECKDCGWYKTNNCPLMDYTKRLVEKCYRKSTDVAREIFAEIDALCDKYPTIRTLGGKTFSELRKKYESEGADDVHNR